MKGLAGGVAALLCVGALSGCGGSDSSSSSSYCDDVKAASQQFKKVTSNQFTGPEFTQISDAVNKIAGEAPADIKSSWTALSTQFDSLKSALASVGVSIDEFAKLAGGDTSAVDPTKVTQLTAAMQKIDSSGMASASSKITAQVKKACKIDLTSP